MKFKPYEENFESDEEPPSMKVTSEALRDNSEKKDSEKTNNDKGGGKILQAAKIIIALGEEQAAQVLSHLDEKTIEKIMAEVVRIGSISPTEREQIIGHFQKEMENAENKLEGGSINAKKYIRTAFEDEDAEKRLERLEFKLEALDFHDIEKFSPNIVARTLSQEMAQTTALIFAFVKPSFAAKVMTALDGAYRVQVARKIAAMKKVSPEVAKTVYRSVLEKLESQADDSDESVEGEQRLSDILNHMNPRLEEKLLSSIEADEPDLVKRMRESMRTFHDLIRLTRDELRKLFEAFPNEQVWGRALKGAGKELIAHILAAVSANRAGDIRDEMKNAGPISVGEIEAARREIMDSVEALEEEGALILRKDREEYVD